MSLSPHCDFCKQELEDYGAILLSPPNQESFVKKFHICKSCYKRILQQEKQ